MKILAVLQNQWFLPSSVASIRRMYAKHGTTPEGRAALNARLLFYRSLTGRRLKAAFGDLCDRIIWEEASDRVGCESSSCFAADPRHIAGVIKHFSPELILSFGNVARDGVKEACFGGYGVDPFLSTRFHCPHPAARGADVPTKLAEVALWTREWIATFAATDFPEGGGER